jgi:hypothetical protein
MCTQLSSNFSRRFVNEGSNNIVIFFNYYSTENIITSDPVFNNVDNYFDTREQAYERSLKRGLHFLEVKSKHNIVDPDETAILTK